MQPDVKKILYVEDEFYARDIVRRALSIYYQVELCENAEEALFKIKSARYDILLIDINLGYGINGIQLFELIRSNDDYKNTPVIALTAYAADSDKEEILSKGFTSYLAKPFSLKTLLKVVDEALGVAPRDG